MRWRAALLGMVMMSAPAAPVALLARAEPPAPEPKTPRDTTVVIAPARWDEPARASLAMLRRVSVKEARRSISALAACEARAGRAAGKRRNARYRACATRPLARTNGFASSNSHILSVLAGTAGPTRACRARVLMLSGTTGSLSFIARSTLRGLDAPWGDLVAASREIRALAGEVRRLARAPGWGSTCRPRPPAPPPPEPTA
jgi:hypothetical protein